MHAIFSHETRRILIQKNQRFLSREFALLLFYTMTCQCIAADIFVSPTGNDRAEGNQAAPLRTVQAAAQRMAPGDTCILRGGVYRNPILLKKGGEQGRPLRFVAYPGETPVLSGAQRLELDWQRYKGDIYKATVTSEFEQLFVDGEMMVEARWPNRPMDKLWDHSTWRNVSAGTRYGRIVDPELTKTGIDFTGAVAVLNVAHQFYSWTRPVIQHEAGSDTFEYPQNLGEDIPIRYGDRPGPWQDDRYFLKGVLAALDIPSEWFLDRETMTLYLWCPDGTSPAGKTIEAKVLDTVLEARDIEYVELHGLHFFAGTFEFNRCNHCLVSGCHLLYPSFSREATDLAPKPERQPVPLTIMRGDGNTVCNSSLGFSSVGGLEMFGLGTYIENCIVHDVCWDGSLRYVPIMTGSYKGDDDAAAGHVRQCTVFNLGNAGICFRGRPCTIERNVVFDGGLSCHDVALIYTGSPRASGSIVRYNWAAGCRTAIGGGLGIRGDDQTRNLSVHHNVVWDTGGAGVIVKGDNNTVCNNTVLYVGTKDRLGAYINMPTRPEPKKAWRKQHPLLEVQNAHSRIYNNAGRTFISQRSRHEPYPDGPTIGSNCRDEDLRLMDAKALDFRPRADSPLVDAGRPLPGITDDAQGKAPDIGAYEYGGEFWRPGHHNGVWLRTKQQGQTTRLEIALTMPVFDTVPLTLRTTSDNTHELRFAPEDWCRPQTVSLGNVSDTQTNLTIGATKWGQISVQDLDQTATVSGSTHWFPEPDIRLPRPIDHCFNTLRYPGAETAQRGLKPAARAYAVSRPPVIDGRISGAEWPGWSKARELLLMSLQVRDGSRPPCGSAYVLTDNEAIYVGIRISHSEPRRLQAQQGQWGVDDGVEIDFQPLTAKQKGPVFVLHGFPNGGLVSVTDGGASDADAKRMENAVQYQSQIDDTGWTAEFRIPCTALASCWEPPRTVEQLQLNVGVRNSSGGDGRWYAWARTGKANYALEQAGVLLPQPTCPAESANLIVNGDFDSDDLSMWHTGSNKDTAFEGDLPIERVQEGPDGSWCMRYRSLDKAAMKRSILKWIQTLPKALEPGVYALSYSMRAIGLEPQARDGSFNAYIRTFIPPKGGTNAGQKETAVVAGQFPWIRRDCTIEIHPDGRLSFVALQLHRASGTIWIDNVALHRIR